MEMHNTENSFERMLIATSEMFKEDLKVEVASCNSHTNKTIKVIAVPECPNTVEVLLPYQIYEGAKSTEICEEWSVNYWKMALRTLALEFAVKGNPSTRYMTRKGPKADPRLYADFFWKRFANMSGWNIVTPEIPVAEVTIPSEKEEKKPICITEAEGEATKEAKAKVDLYEIYKMMGLEFAAL